MTPRRILVVEDDAAIREGLIDALEAAGYATFEAADGLAGRDSALSADYDLLLLDLVLPGAGGFDILRELRETRPEAPVIILTAKGDEASRVQGLKLGADDYVVKPFSVAELLARVEAVLRRSAERPPDVLEAAFPGGAIDFARRELRFDDGHRESVSDRELGLLRYLAKNRGRVVARDELLARVWRVDPAYIVDSRTVDMAVARLREKLRDDPAAPRIILTVRGRGYCFGASGR
jgi:DNA-binding response OmpR family regulator